MSAGAVATAAALLEEPLLHTSSRPQAWPQWAAAQGLEPARLQQGQGFEHLYYLLEAAAAGLGEVVSRALEVLGLLQQSLDDR